MNNNDIIRRIRYTFDFNDNMMIQLFELGGKQVDRAIISGWLKSDSDEDQKPLYDFDLSVFLNGFIALKRGVKDGDKPIPEKSLTNNIILRKLKIALDLKTDDILDILMLADFKMSIHEVNAFFRKPSQKQYRVCKDQILRNFLVGMLAKYDVRKESK